MHYMLDTNICIYIINRSPQEVYRHFRDLKVGDICISAITAYELQFGIAKSQRPKENQIALMDFLAPLEVLDLPFDAASLYGKLRADLQKQGKPIGNFDLLIATHALHLGLILITNNEKEFQRIPGLKVENWAKI